MSDAVKRKQAVKVTVTGVELDEFESCYSGAKRNADRLAKTTADGAGDLSDVADLAVNLAYMEANANALHVLTGSAEWKERYQQARVSRSHVGIMMGSRQRAIVARLNAAAARLEALSSGGE